MRSLAELRGLTLLLGSVASSLNTTSDGTYLNDGPCGALPAAHYTVSVDVLGPAGNVGAQRQLELTVTLPAHGVNVEPNTAQIHRSAPYPVVFFFNGFLVRCACLVTAPDACLGQLYCCCIAAPYVL